MIELTPEKAPYYKITENPKTYLTLLNQSGATAPTENILINTLNEKPIWSYQSTGQYIITFTQTLFNETTAIIPGQGNIFIYTEVSSPNTIILTTRDNSFAYQDGLLYFLPLLIIIKPQI